MAWRLPASMIVWTSSTALWATALGYAAVALGRWLVLALRGR
jgi:hypothetical protein